MTDHPLPASELVRIEPEDRLVVLARTLDVQGPDAGLSADVEDGAGFGAACLGRALYRHGAVFRGVSDAPVWSHLELSYFRDIVPAEVIRDRVAKPQREGTRLLRAEILLTTPSSFVLPRDWRGVRERADLQASLEYIDVGAPFLGDYRDIMRRYIGPAAARLVAAGRMGTFRTMETAAVLHRDPGFAAEWNQIHLSEVAAEGFDGFGPAFDVALREIAPEGGFVAVFAGLERMRTIPRWTFNDAVVEADGALAGESRAGV